MRKIFRALTFFKDDWRLILIWLIMIAAQIGLGVLMPWPRQVLIDSVVTSKVAPTTAAQFLLSHLPGDQFKQVIILTFIWFLMKMTMEGLGWVRGRVNRHVELNGTLRARCSLYDKMQELGPAYQKSQPPGDLIYRTSTDVEGCRVILNVLCDMAFACVSLTLMGYIMWQTNVVLSLIVLAFGPMLLLCSWWFSTLVNAYTLDAKQADAGFTTSLIRSISGIFVVQAYCRQVFESGRFATSAKKSATAWRNVNNTVMSYNFVTQGIFAVANTLVMGYGFVLVANGSLTVGTLLVFITYLTDLWDPLSRLTGVLVNLRPGTAGAQRVFEVLDTAPATTDPLNPTPLQVRNRKITLDHVAFRYPNGAEALRDFSAVIEPGQVVAFVGPSGSGKSTVLNLLMRFYDIPSGTVRLDGWDVRTIKTDDLRKHMAFVSQDSIMLPTTIAENIAYGNENASAEEIRRVSEMSGSAEFVDKLEHGYETVLSENGGNLSGGQRQRLSIARALLSPAPIIVADEPTSALDPENEQIVMNSLLSQRGNRTVVIVTHRLSTIASADKIFVVKDGEVCESGTHAELIERNGVYWTLAQEEAAGITRSGTKPDRIRLVRH